MSYEAFMAGVNALIRHSRQSILVRFSIDEDKRKYRAVCTDGTVISGCSSSLRVTVKRGDGHTSMTTI